MTTPIPDPARHAATAVTAALNDWNARSDNPRPMLCATGHGTLTAVPAASEPGAQWSCPVCAATQPATDDQTRTALGMSALPAVPDACPDQRAVRMPDGVRGDRGDGSVRLSTPVSPDKHMHPQVTGAGLLGCLLGAGAGAVLAPVGGSWLAVAFPPTHPSVDALPTAIDLLSPFVAPAVFLLLCVLVAGVAGHLIGRMIWPVAAVTATHPRPARSLAPGDWVAVPHDRSVTTRATRVVQISGLPRHHRCHPGVRLELLDGTSVECPASARWLVLELT
jgi:hypothetical protein